MVQYARREEFALIEIQPPGRTVIFEYFPSSITKNSRANWETQNVTIGVKPLMYANREPLRITIDELLIESYDAQTSIQPQIDALLSLQAEKMQPGEQTGAPPILLVIYGDYQQTVVLEEVTIKESFFTRDATLIRAYVILTLVEINKKSNLEFRPPRLERRPGVIERPRRAT